MVILLKPDSAPGSKRLITDYHLVELDKVYGVREEAEVTLMRGSSHSQ
jgi:hypothetical protein